MAILLQEKNFGPNVIYYVAEAILVEREREHERERVRERERGGDGRSDDRVNLNSSGRRMIKTPLQNKTSRSNAPKCLWEHFGIVSFYFWIAWLIWIESASAHSAGPLG